MTAPQDQFSQVARQGQEAITAAMQTWTESFQSLVGGGAPAASGLPTPQQVVDNVFDFAEQLLASQREFVKQVLAAGMEANETATSKAREAMDSMSTRTTAATDVPSGNGADTVRATNGTA